MANDTHEVRDLKYKIKQLGKQCGKQGQTIHHLRGEVAALRRLVNISPGDLERIMAGNAGMRAESKSLRAENEKLRRELAKTKPQGGALVGGIGVGGGIPGTFGKSGSPGSAGGRGANGTDLQREISSGYLADRAGLSDQR